MYDQDSAQVNACESKSLGAKGRRSTGCELWNGLHTAVAVLICIGLLAVPSHADAVFQGVGHFAGSAAAVSPPFAEEVQLGGTGGMTVNYTGNGGVPAGTVYATSYIPNGGLGIAMYVPKTGGGLRFSRNWEVPAVGELYERCGPDLPSPTACPPRAIGTPGSVDVDVDEATGNVYVLFGELIGAGSTMIFEFSPEGEALITRFGEISPEDKATAETPGMIHSSFFPGGIAVNQVGEVYVYDENLFQTRYSRLMKFRPKTPGVFTEYEYAGTAEDVGASLFGQGRRPQEPVLDEAGNIYVASEQTYIEMYDPANPGNPAVCSFAFEKGGVTAITVDPKAGTPFFFSYKQPKRLYQLGPCDPGSGKFKGGIIGETTVAPERDDLWGLAFDPIRQFSPTQPAGMLYAGAPRAVPNSAVGTGEPGQSSLGYIFAPAEELPPIVESQTVSTVTTNTARLKAVINPKGFKTRFAFQYLTAAAYEAAGETFDEPAEPTEAPVGEAFLAGTGAAESVGVTLTGLLPDTAYRFRAVATNHCAPSEPEKVCEDAGVTQAFHTYPAEAPGLHDNRVYELVSPAQKNGGQVLPADPGLQSCGDCKPGAIWDHFPMQSAPNGEAVVYEGTGFAPGVGVTRGNEYIARRDPNLGWQSVNLSPGLMQLEGRGYKAFDGGLTEGLFGQTGPALSPAAPPEYKNLYARATTSPFALAPLLTVAPPNRPATESGAFEASFAGASADLSRVFLQANDVLTAEVTGIAPEPEDGGATKFNLYEWERATGQLRLVNVLPGNAATKAGVSIGVPSTGAVSADGSRVFWSDEAGKVYVREDASLTKEIPDPGKFLSANTDGSKVLLTNGHLYDLETEAVTDLTGGKAGFQGISGQSNDLSHVYFVDTEVLTGEELNSEGAKAQAGKPNLYAWDSEIPVTHFAATLLPSDNTSSDVALSKTWSPQPSRRTAEASPNGRFLAFSSAAQLTGFDNSGLCKGSAGTPGEALCPESEVFLYDSQTERLECPSCNTSGRAAIGFSALRLISPSGEPLPQPRYLLDSGRLYFDSQESLSQFDTNEGVEDVYQFQGQGTGNCESESGCVTLISTGRDNADSNFLAVDASGRNVFFTSRERLVSADTDELIDLYDAREGGGFPFEQKLPQGPCQGEGCQIPPPTPAPPPPSSEVPGGEGNNVQPVKCKKGQVKKNGKCVKKKHRPKKNNKKGGKGKRGGAR
jgi:hypothetical protein